MRCLIIDDAGTITMEDSVHVVMILKDPAVIPAMAVYPRGANTGVWHSKHNEVLAERERQAMAKDGER